MVQRETNWRHYMVISIKRLYRGLCTLRSDQINKAITKGEDLIILCQGEKMTIPNEDIKSSVVNISAPLPSKFNINQTYKLVDFLWMPS